MVAASKKKRPAPVAAPGSTAEPAKPKKLHKNGGAQAADVPEATEVIEIAQTQSLYKSNLFRLQLEELLRELVPKQSHPALESFLRSLHPVLQSLVARDISAELQSEFPNLYLHQRNPFPVPFQPPRRIDVVGSFLLGTCLRSHMSVDLALEMPPEALQSKDYLNFRYMDKRAAYAAEICRQLRKSGESGEKCLRDMDVSLEALQGDLFRPCVILRAAGPAGPDPWQVRLLPVHAADAWPALRLAPDRNAVRPHDASGSPENFPATSQYNSCILEDSRMRTHLEMIHRAVQRVPALRDTILLLKRWAFLRGFLQPTGESVCIPLSGFCLSMLAAHASQTASIAPMQTSSFQLFKLALGVLASTDWQTHKVLFGKASPALLSTAEKKACRAHFYDSEEGLLNIFWRLGPFIADIKWEAQRSLSILDSHSDPYDAVFGQRMSPELIWDVVVRTPVLGPGSLCPELGSSGVDTPEALALASNLVEVLTSGLGDRCVRVAARLVGSLHARWKDDRPSNGLALLVGVVLDASKLDRILDRGPAAEESSKVSEFRSLWGPDKVELRRFRDGSILECVAWTKPPRSQVESGKSPAVVTQILKHLLARHARDLSARCSIVSGPVGFIGNLGEKERRLWIAFEVFQTHLRQLSSLPLTIKDINAADTSFSYTCVSPQPAPMATDGVARTLHSVTMEFESSGRWPSDPEAARKVCLALLLQMRQELQTDLAIEAEVSDGFIDVRYPEFVFRVRIFHQYEMTATAQRVTNFQDQTAIPMPSSENLERFRMLWWRPRVCAALHGHVLQQPALAGAARLCKQWLASQMLSGLDDFVEHLVAFAFLSPMPFETPTSPQIGLSRFLWLLESFDWQHEPLVVDFDGKLTEEERLSIRQSFERSRAGDARAISFRICSRFDPHSFLLETPPATVSAWLIRRARQALAVFRKQLLGSAGPWSELFALDTSIFDLTLRLKRGSREGREAKRSGRGAPQTLVGATREAALTLVDKLRMHLSPVCLVFHDIDNGLVALKWRPGAFLPQQHALMGAVPHTLLQAQRIPLHVPNILCLTSMIASLAEGMLESDGGLVIETVE
mmetsp:Transcript_49331/g.107412  ORF Transcript_49331/g.107412 Transcript_49331/m.107412 type:complete len:1079 (+) Transcript_49331:58-3294(+)